MSGLARQVAGAAATRAEQPDAETQVRELIKAQLPRLKAIMPAVMDDRRLAGLVMNEIPRAPNLALCTPESLVGCVLRVAQLGLELGPDLGEAYLIPRKNGQRMECSLQLGYKGVLALARRSPDLLGVVARAVHDGDDFEYQYGTEEFLRHIPATERGEVTHAYCVARLRGGTEFVVLNRAEIDARRARGQGGPAWKSDYPAMAAKSAVMAMRPWLPLTTMVAEAFAQDGAAITVSARGTEVLEAHHDQPAGLEPPSIVVPPDPDTGEVAPTMIDVPAEPESSAPQPDEERPRTVAEILAGHGIEPPVHLAVISKATGGRTTNPAEVRDDERGKLATWARNCAGNPVGFVTAVLAKLPEGGEDEAALSSWLRDQEAAT